MSNQEQAPISSTFPIEELTRFHSETIKSSDITKPEGTLIANDDIVRFNGYYALDITTGKNKGKEGAFFTIDTNMYVTTDKAGTPTAKYYLQFILSMDGKSSVTIPFTGTFNKISPGKYQLIQKTKDIGGMNAVNLDLTFSHGRPTSKYTAEPTATFSGNITVAAPGQLPATVSGSTYNNPILPSTYFGTYYEDKKAIGHDTDPVKTLEICNQHELNYRPQHGNSLKRIPAYKFNLNMYVFSFPSPSDNGEMISLVMGTSPASGLICGDLTSKSGSATTQRTLNTILTPEKSPSNSPLLINLNDNELASFSAYYPLPLENTTGAFIAIEANHITKGEVNLCIVTIGVSIDGQSSCVQYYDDLMSFTDNKLKIPNPASAYDPQAHKWLTDITFTRGYEKNGKSGHLVKIEGEILGEHITSHTAFNPIPLNAFGGATLVDANDHAETLIVNSNHEVTYKGYKVGTHDGKNVGKGTPHQFVYVPIMYILEFTNPEPPEIDIVGMEYKVVCSFGTDAEQGLACIVTEYTLKDKKVINQVISYYHSVPKITQSNTSKSTQKQPVLT